MPEFKDTKFMTAKEKQTVIRAWERFLKNGCKPNDFTKALYHHLINHCSFIAHYDLGGFYSTYFSEPEDTTISSTSSTVQKDVKASNMVGADGLETAMTLPRNTTISITPCAT